MAIKNDNGKPGSGQALPAARGYFKIWRGIEDHPALQELLPYAVWHVILAETAHRDRFDSRIGEWIPKGFALISARKLTARFRVRPLAIQQTLELFEREGMILRESVTNKGQLIKVINWDRWQG